MSDDAATNLPRLVAALGAVTQWREGADAEVSRQGAQILEEERQVREQIDALQRQLEELAARRGALEDRVASLDAEHTRRARRAVLEGLTADGEVLSQRASAFAASVANRKTHVQAMIDEPEMGGLVHEYEQFMEVQATLDSLPASYRQAMLAHNDNVRRRLQPVFDAIEAPIPPVDAETSAITLVASVDPPQGTPEALAVIVPVDHDVYANWGDRPEDLASRLSFRVVAAVAGMLRDIGASDAPVQYAPYEGRLAIQVWLGDSQIQGDIKDALGGHIDRLREEADGLRAARLELYAAWLNPDVIAPDAEEDMTDGIS